MSFPGELTLPLWLSRVVKPPPPPHKKHCQGVLRFGLDEGVPLEPQNPYPFLRVILTGKSTVFVPIRAQGT